MSKSKFIKTGPSLPVRLAKMGSLPSSEDLKYMLATAAKEGKQVELPFMNPETDLNFMVKVIAASSPVASPRWTFGRLENGVFKHVWSKESNEVIMIQGKIKVDGASKGEYESVDNYEHSSIKAHQGALAPAFGWKRREKDFGFESQPLDPELAPYDPEPPAFQNTGSFGTTSFEFDRPQTAETDADNAQAQFSVSHPVSQTGEFQPFLLPPASLPFAKFDQAPKKLPPPVEFDQDLDEAFGILGDPETGLLCYSAFSFFLMREFEHSLQSSQDLAVIVFEILDKNTLASTELSINDGAAVTEAFNSIRASLDFCARSEESEFAIVLPYYNSQDAVSFAASLYTCLSENLVLTAGENGDQERVFTIGVAGRTNSIKDAGTLFACARKAKEDARNSSCPYLLFQ
jgi:GGDEF domain-containing protein